MSPPDQGLGMPALVCAALSAELALKELLNQRRISFKREHRLLELLKLLPQQDSDSIRADLAPDLSISWAAVAWTILVGFVLAVLYCFVP